MVAADSAEDEWGHDSLTKEGAAAFRPPGCRLVKDTPHTFPRYEGVVISLTDDMSPGRVALAAVALSGLGTRSRRRPHSCSCLGARRMGSVNMFGQFFHTLDCGRCLNNVRAPEAHVSI